MASKRVGDRRRKSFGFGGPGTMVLPDSELFTLSSVGEQQEHKQGES